MLVRALAITFLFLTALPAVFSQDSTPLFRSVVEKRLRDVYNRRLDGICSPVEVDPVEARVFDDYGAIFISKGTDLPTFCIFANELAVQDFQSKARSETMTIGSVKIKLQKAAMEALVAARAAAAKSGLSITPRGGSAASTRSFAKTVELWNSRFLPGLDYWVRKKRIDRRDAAAVRKAPLDRQVAAVLTWEDQGIYFSQDKKKSILYSVAVPGASQHIFMLALDVEQFADKRVRQILADHGWFQTVKSDLPHFTYLGVTEKELPSLGLTVVEVSGQKFWIPNVGGAK